MTLGTPRSERLLFASSHAYAIGGSGPDLTSAPTPVPDTLVPPDPPRSQRTGYPQAIGFQAGADLIDAGLVGVAADAIIVAFRGTLPPGGPDHAKVILDWVNNADCPLLPGPGLPGLVHQGFLSALDDLWPWLVGSIRDELQANPGKPVWVTGHSKGGAVAHLAAMRLKSTFPDATVAVETFAAARCGNDQFAAAYAQAIPDALRWEYADDIVPHLPPADAADLKQLPIIGGLLGDLHDGYVSVGALQYIDGSGKLVPDSPGLQDQRLAHLAGLLDPLRFQVGQIPADHSIDPNSGYATAICGPNL